ncbi:hypothetical protein [Chryseobacterium rhizosphaerae]|uniref:hypothetical protein n=1 Tax=Chryseobacterium rhizosphaerae TaxID=395937 RepID=UPI000646D316|nr:hypothetical protein [Chryseobacterium rhizosphaerae]MDC8100616.1 hypothetical protein [Chryseobacterium rhizosphaerae]MDR6545174.1 hypothetical protein [Chryseobacterium rhizosphaerae]
MFKIITKKQMFLGNLDLEDTTVTEAIYTLYLNDNMMININWNGFVIPMNGSSFSQVYNDVILMLELIINDEKEFSINFLDSCFTAIWNFSNYDDMIKVEANWIAIASYGDINVSLENLYKTSNTLIIKKQNFIEEWNSLFKIIKEDLLKVGYNDTLDNFEYLKTLN